MLRRNVLMENCSLVLFESKYCTSNLTANSSKLDLCANSLNFKHTKFLVC